MSNVGGGSRRGIYDKDDGRFVANLLGGSLNQKLASSELLLRPLLPHKFQHKKKKRRDGGLIGGVLFVVIVIDWE